MVARFYLELISLLISQYSLRTSRLSVPETMKMISGSRTRNIEKSLFPASQQRLTKSTHVRFLFLSFLQITRNNENALETLEEK